MGDSKLGLNRNEMKQLTMWRVHKQANVTDQQTGYMNHRTEGIVKVQFKDQQTQLETSGSGTADKLDTKNTMN